MAIELRTWGKRLRALDDDEPMGSDLVNRVSRERRRSVPIRRVPGAPGRSTVRLVVDVRAHHVWERGVAVRQHFPSGEPIRLAVTAFAVPQVEEMLVVARAVVVQHDEDVVRGRFGDDDIHRLERCLALELGVHPP